MVHMLALHCILGKGRKQGRTSSVGLLPIKRRRSLLQISRKKTSCNFSDFLHCVSPNLTYSKVAKVKNSIWENLQCHIYERRQNCTHDNRHTRETQNKPLSWTLNVTTCQRVLPLLKSHKGVLSVVFNWKVCAICGKGTGGDAAEFSSESKQRTPVLNSFQSLLIHTVGWFITEPRGPNRVS